MYADLDLDAAKPQATEVEAGQNYRPLAPTLTSVVGLMPYNVGIWSGPLPYQYMGSRSASEDNSIVAKSYFVNDL